MRVVVLLPLFLSLASAWYLPLPQEQQVQQDLSGDASREQNLSLRRSKAYIGPNNEDAANDADGEDYEEDEVGENVVLFDPILNILANIFPPTRHTVYFRPKKMSKSEEGSY